MRPCINVVLAAMVVAAMASCASGKSADGKQEANTKPLRHIRFYMETRHDIPDRSMEATVGRDTPMKFSVEKLPVLNEIHVAEAALVEEPGGFQLKIQFNRLGTQLLENYTSAGYGRHLLVMADIDDEARWIAAPLIRRRIGDGVIAFTPDATREEMSRLVEGLNRAVKKRQRQWLE